MPHEPPERLKHFFKFYGIEAKDTPERGNLIQYSRINSALGFIYLIRCGDYLKIGIASNLYERLSQLQIGNPLPLRLCCYFETTNPEKDEKSLHRLFQQHHVRGEWFRLDENEFHKAVSTSGLGLTPKEPPKPNAIVAEKIASNNHAITNEFIALKDLAEEESETGMKSSDPLPAGSKTKLKTRMPPAKQFIQFSVICLGDILWSGKVGQLVRGGPLVIMQSRISNISISHRNVVEKAIKAKQIDVCLDGMHYHIEYGKNIMNPPVTQPLLFAD